MSNSSIQHVKQIARQIKYRELTEYIGEYLVINELATIEADLMQQLSPALPDEATMQLVEQKFVEGALSKYGLIDVTFEVSKGLLEESYQSGIKLLRDVKFFSTLPSPDEVESYNDAVEVSELILQDRIDELALGKTFCYSFCNYLLSYVQDCV